MAKAGSSLFVVIFIVYTNTICSVKGIRCFACDSSADGDICGTSFKMTSSNTSYIVDNCDYCSQYHFSNDRVIIRSCAKTTGLRVTAGCDSCKLSGVRVRACYCDDDLCNSAVSRKRELNLLLSVIVVCLLLNYKN
ncbi:uncharacterized protein LOC132746882 [Ruditapes philippinarum]|uniref:uncharacterized protein LOC132746882 n=1 Tax=Ruditapes philippinarum TaxID=129788 RepID=UPI00295A9208|nr:uncharacterized protein LOC132746882 [Ruditapes philippinarum]